MTSPISWKLGLYTRNATAVQSTSYDGATTNVYLKHATDITWSIPLNGIDQLNFSLYLDDPAATLIHRKSNIIRLWRDINDTDNGKIKTTPTNTPDFAGIVTAIRKDGSEGKMQVTCMSPLWLLQSKFHIENHRLVTDSTSYGDPSDYEGGNLDNLPWDQSALMFRIIDLINGAFNDSGGDTGIRKPPTATFDSSTHFWPKTANVSPFFISKGTTPWSHIFENLMLRPEAPDIIPQYIYTASSKNLMYFYTNLHRGTDRTGSISLDYRTGNKNLSNLIEDAQVVPGSYGNYLWAVGDGGPNGGVVGADQDATDISTNGIYMVRKDIKGARLRDIDDLATSNLQLALQNDDETYEAEIEPLTPFYYDIDFTVGDLVKLNANKGALLVNNVSQRIYQADLSLSDTNVETCKLTLSNDFKVKY